ncbi:MAG: tetratricopeptide repeat protein [Chloroflexota bacterium]
MFPSWTYTNSTDDRWARIFVKGIACLVCFFVFLCLPTVALGEEPTSAPHLLPLDPEESIELTAYVATAALDCEGKECELRHTQRYQIHNEDKGEQRVVRIAPSQPSGEPLSVRDVQVRDGAGEPMVPTEGDTFQSGVWEIVLPANGNKELTLSYVQPLSAPHFVVWRPVVSPLEAWGSAGSARLTLELPQYAVESILLNAEPSHYRFDGSKLEWQYEEIASPAHHEAVLYAPPTWQRLRELQKDDAHYALAQLYTALKETAEEEGVPYADPFAQIMAELQAAIETSPQHTEARMDLANLYLEKSDLSPELSLNYLLLAAQELAAILQYEPQNQEVAERLSRTYYRAAQRAEEVDDPEGALLYLKEAGQVPNAPTPYEKEELENLRLRLALELAERGQVREALTQIQGTVAPETEEEFLHYAPPLTGVRTRVDLRPTGRRASYEFQFYPPLAPRGRKRLEEVAQRIESLDDCQVTLQPDHKENVTLLEIHVPLWAPEDLQAWGRTLQKAFSAEEDMIAAFVTQPWHVEIEAYDVQEDPWGKRYRYQERVSLSHTEKLWEQKAQYARWRLIELREGSAEDEIGRQRQRLALIALSEQRQAWKQLSPGSYWTYTVHYEDDAQSATWLLSWGQTRDLDIDHYVYRWPFIFELFGGAVLFALVLCLAVGRGRG